MNTRELLIKITDCTYSEVIKVLLKRNIYYSNLTINENYITLKINKEDYKKLKYDIKTVHVIKHLGLDGLIAFLKKHYVLLISFIFTYIILIILSNVIFDVQIITNNYELKRVINLYLEDYDIKKYKFMKSNKELTKIKEKILEENKTTLEWIEIERIGTTYKINLTERIINEKNEDLSTSDIVAKKDAMIMYVITKKWYKNERG